MGKAYLMKDFFCFTIYVGKEDESTTEIKAHKLVLMACSPTFDAMLKSGMKENKLNIIDFDVEVVQATVDYFYDCDNFKEMSFDHLIGLLHFVDKYHINDAKDKIQNLLLLHIYPDTICQIANSSITANSPALKGAIFKCLKLYIRENVPFDDADSLDKDLGVALLRSLSLPDEEEDIISSSEDDEIMSDS